MGTESERESNTRRSYLIRGLDTLIPSFGDLRDSKRENRVAAYFISARYEDDHHVDAFLSAAENGPEDRKCDRQQARVIDSDRGDQAWQVEAERMIREANAVVCLAGPGFPESEGIRWELKVAESLRKPILILATDSTFDLNDPSIPTRAVIVSDLTPAEAGSRVDSLVLSAALSLREDPLSDATLLEQYRLIVDTAERLEDRRQKLHTFFLSINSLLLAAIGFVGKSALDGDPLVALAILGIALLGWLLASTWRSQIKGYERVRAGKFTIINEMEAHLPAAPFVAEWIAILQRGYEVFTDSEQRVPNAFATLYILAAVAAVILVVSDLF